MSAEGYRWVSRIRANYLLHNWIPDLLMSLSDFLSLPSHALHHYGIYDIHSVGRRAANSWCHVCEGCKSGAVWLAKQLTSFASTPCWAFLGLLNTTCYSRIGGHPCLATKRCRTTSFHLIPWRDPPSANLPPFYRRRVLGSFFTFSNASKIVGITGYSHDTRLRSSGPPGMTVCSRAGFNRC